MHAYTDPHRDKYSTQAPIPANAPMHNQGMKKEKRKKTHIEINIRCYTLSINGRCYLPSSHVLFSRFHRISS